METRLLDAHVVVHFVGSSDPESSGQAWPSPSQADSEGEGPGGA